MKFKPCGTLKLPHETVCLNLDELEAIRLADYEGLYQEQAAEKMNISRQTFGNIITTAHKKIADFLVNSKQLTVGGGTVEIDHCKFICSACEYSWTISCGAERPNECPKCKSIDFNCLKKASNGITFKKCWRDL
jgi:predicted DNA-binding protein (UPF0251 family)